MDQSLLDSYNEQLSRNHNKKLMLNSYSTAHSKSLEAKATMRLAKAQFATEAAMREEDRARILLSRTNEITFNKEALELCDHRWDILSISDIASVLELSSGQVSHALHSSLRKLSKLLDRDLLDLITEELLDDGYSKH